MFFAALLLWAIALASGGWRSLDASAFGLLALSGLIGIFIGDTALFACMNRLGPRRSGLLVAGVMLAILRGRREDEVHAWEQTRGRGVPAFGLRAGSRRARLNPPAPPSPPPTPAPCRPCPPDAFSPRP